MKTSFTTMWSGWVLVKKPNPRECDEPHSRPPDIVIRPPHTIDPDAVRSAATPLQARARSFARHVITPTVVAAAETWRCEPTLTRDVAFEPENACRQAVREAFRRAIPNHEYAL
jgi:hypothetical protein